MKYICVLHEDGFEEIIVFPRTINHDCMAEVAGGIKNKIHGNWQRVRREVISAGFVTSSLQCIGASVSLGIKSREEDTSLLKKQFQ